MWHCWLLAVSRCLMPCLAFQKKEKEEMEGPSFGSQWRLSSYHTNRKSPHHRRRRRCFWLYTSKDISKMVVVVLPHSTHTRHTFIEIYDRPERGGCLKAGSQAETFSFVFIKEEEENTLDERERGRRGVVTAGSQPGPPLSLPPTLLLFLGLHAACVGVTFGNSFSFQSKCSIS